MQFQTKQLNLNLDDFFCNRRGDRFVVGCQTFQLKTDRFFDIADGYGSTTALGMAARQVWNLGYKYAIFVLLDHNTKFHSKAAFRLTGDSFYFICSTTECHSVFLNPLQLLPFDFARAAQIFEFDLQRRAREHDLPERDQQRAGH